jgi:hypothetical protein
MPGKFVVLVCGIVLVAGLFMVNPAAAVQRCMLAELFTSTT